MAIKTTLGERFGDNFARKSLGIGFFRDSLLVKQLISVPEMDIYAEQWRDLDRRTTAPMVWFQSFEWCRNWMAVHGKGRFEPHIVLLFRGNVVTAVLPMMIETTPVGVRILRSLGEPHSQYANILTETGSLQDEELAILAKALHKIRGADGLVLNLVPEGSPLAKLLPEQSQSAELQNASQQFVFDGMSTGAEFTALRKSSIKKKMRKSMQQLQARGTVSFTVVRPNDARYLNWIKDCLRFKKQWLNRTGRISTGLEFAGHGAFLAALPQADGDGNGPVLSALLLDGKPVAIEIGFVQHGHYYSYIGGFDWSFRQLSPGKVQMEMTLAWLIDNGVRVFDLLANPSDYKADYSNRTVSLSGHAMSMTRYGKVYASVWQSLLRPALKHSFKMLPADLRVGVSILRKLELSYSA
jgi:CelD/BcsL family acetyltransferase involved in cellulose biosynthesis